MKNFIAKTIRNILDFIYPPGCYMCESSTLGYGLCPDCFSKLRFSLHNTCKHCGVEINENIFVCGSCSHKRKSFDSLSHCFEYNDELFKLINSFKNYDNTNLSPYLAKFLLHKLKEKGLENMIDVIIPVPVHRKKLLHRKYSHTALLAKELSHSLKIAFAPRVLIKIKSTADQISLDGKSRLNNLKRAFVMNKNMISLVENKSVLLLDDVITTGTTINECSTVLKSSGVKEVHVLSLARIEGILKV